MASCISSGAGDGPLGVVGPLERRPEDGQDGVADELVDGAVVFLDHRRHLAEIVVQQLDDGLGRQRVGERREPPEVRHHDRDGPLLAAEIQPFGRFEQAVGDLARHVAAKGLFDESRADLELIRAFPYLVLEVLDEFGVLDGNGDLSRQERQEAGALRCERGAGQIVLEVDQSDELALIQDRLAENGAGLPLLNVRVRHEALVLLSVVDDHRLLGPRGEVDDARAERRAAPSDESMGIDMRTAASFGHDAAFSLHVQLAVPRQQQERRAGHRRSR